MSESVRDRRFLLSVTALSLSVLLAGCATGGKVAADRRPAATLGRVVVNTGENAKPAPVQNAEQPASLRVKDSTPNSPAERRLAGRGSNPFANFDASGSKDAGLGDEGQDPFLSEAAEAFRNVEADFGPSLRETVTSVADEQRAVSEQAATELITAEQAVPTVDTSITPEDEIRQVAERTVERPEDSDRFDALAQLFEEANRRRPIESKIDRPLPPPGKPLGGSVVPFEAGKQSPAPWEARPVKSVPSIDQPLDSAWSAVEGEVIGSSAEYEPQEAEVEPSGVEEGNVAPTEDDIVDQPAPLVGQADPSMIIDANEVPRRVDPFIARSAVAADERRAMFAVSPMITPARPIVSGPKGSADLFPIISRDDEKAEEAGREAIDEFPVDFEETPKPAASSPPETPRKRAETEAGPALTLEAPAAESSKVAQESKKLAGPSLLLPATDDEDSAQAEPTVAKSEGASLPDPTKSDRKKGSNEEPSAVGPALSLANTDSDSKQQSDAKRGPKLSGPSLSLQPVSIVRPAPDKNDKRAAVAKTKADAKPGEQIVPSQIHLDDVDFDVETINGPEETAVTAESVPPLVWYGLGIACIGIVVTLVRRMRR